MSFLRTRLSMAAVMATASGAPALAQNSLQEDPIPETPRQSLLAIEKAFVALPTAQTMLFPQIRGQLQEAPEFLRDSKASINIRSFYRDTISNAPNRSTWTEGWAAGGSVSFETGRLFGLLSGGMVLYTSFPVYAPPEHDGTGLLGAGGRQYGVLGQLYGMVHLDENNQIIAGRYLFDTPFIGPSDTRMTPKTFYGYVLRGTAGDRDGGPFVRYGGGYIAAMKERNATEFISMARSAGAGEDRGTDVLGGMFSWGPMRIGAIDYYTQDTMNIFYAEGKVGASLGPQAQATLAAQFASQTSTGMNLLNGGTYWATSDFGAQMQLGYRSGIFRAAYTIVDQGFSMQTPWSTNPFYTDAMIRGFNRAGQSAFMTGLSYVATPLGLPGVGISAFYFRGWTQAPAAGAPVLEDEIDFNLEWRPQWEMLKGLWLRGRYGRAQIDQAGSRTVSDEVRLILNYSLKLY